MLEIKIPAETVSVLLKERMKYELQMRKAAEYFDEEICLEDLNYTDIKSIAESAAFDLIFLLPAEIFSTENNLPEIVSKSIQSLVSVYKIRELGNYSTQMAKNLLNPIRKSVEISIEEKAYLTN
ncbi:MAG: hypothetical protein JEY94_09230 [Melioribacteraceae bacterium]|nr:hypothetical protein [Melioribacteraceae bacterium]